MILIELFRCDRNILSRFRQSLVELGLVLAICAIALFGHGTPALANIDDDRYDGNIFILYAGNGSLVPPRLNLKESLQREIPAVLVFYVDDSRDCKEFSLIVSRIQEFYGRAANVIPVSVDSLLAKSDYTPQEPGYYYSGVVPQTVILNGQGEKVYEAKGQVPYEQIDDRLREVFDLLPRSESIELKRRSFNEYNSELVE
ncbi:thylakoid membrane photosystem I accumulation factor [Myxosarcina sp. GI1]|uniref:thylakoid membrane photosystem I accumulation factor n=1 Tax=Myxosarcina sp. GI1 TaxID=1541065 RepID=UPI000566275E|nr:thylakoid membrane photosystem I accumulation factor [Myxosarcina sp. GI1]